MSNDWIFKSIEIFFFQYRIYKLILTLETLLPDIYIDIDTMFNNSEYLT